MRKTLIAILFAFCALFSVLAPDAGHAQNPVSEIQSLLTAEGYDPGPIDGAWGGRTERALRNYLADRDIDPASVFSRAGSDRNALLDLLRQASDQRSGGDVQVVPQLGHSGAVNGLALSPDETLLVSTGGNIVRIWDVATGRLLRTLEGHSGGGGYTGQVVFSPDGTKFATSGTDDIKIRDVATGRTLHTIRNPQESHPNRIAFSPDGHTLIGGFGGSQYDGYFRLHLWNVANGRHIRQAVQHQIGSNFVTFSPDGQHVATGDAGDGALTIWNATTGRELRTLQSDMNDYIRTAAFSPDGRHLVLPGENAKQLLTIWSIETGERIAIRDTPELSRGSFLSSVAYSPDGQRIAAGTKYGKLFLLDGATGAQITASDQLRFTISHILFSQNGRWLFAAGSSSNIYQLDVEEMIQSGDANNSVVRSFGGAVNTINTVAYSPDGQGVITADNRGTITVWDPNTGEVLRTLREGRNGVKEMALSRDGSLLAARWLRGRIAIVDTQSGELVTTLRTDEPDSLYGSIFGIAWSPDGTRIAAIESIKSDKRLLVWDVVDGKQVVQTPLRSVLFWSAIKYSPDGRHLITSISDGPTIWDARTGSLVRVLSGPDSAALTVAYSHDGSRIAAGFAGTNEIVVWNARNGRRLASFKPHTDQIWSVQFSADDTHLVASSADSKISIINLQSRSVQTLRGHLAGVNSFALSPDGIRIASSGYDGTLRWWSTETGRLLATNINLNEGDRLTITPDGFFDESPGASLRAHIVRGLESYSIDQFHQALYRPDLVREALAGDSRGEVARAAQGLNLNAIIEGRVPPSIEIIAPTPRKKAEGETINVQIAVMDQGGGVGRIEWKINGITVGLGVRGLARIEENETEQNQAQKLNRTLLLEPGTNLVEVIAYDEDNLISSEPVSVVIEWDGVTGLDPPQLHVVAVGVNDYWDNQLQLNYAVPDARSLADAFRNAAPQLFDEVHIHTVLDDKVTVQGLAQVFSELSDRIKPQDVFVFFIAGHGKTVDGQYYFLPQDFRYRNADSIVSDGIGQDQWQEWFAQIQARKSVLLYDTCESGSLTGERIAERGLGRLTAIDKLTRAMGRTVLSASTDDAPALEGYRGHGVFTYALLEALERADANGNDLIEVTELAAFVDDRVPAISHDTFGVRQVPQMRIVGSNFSITSRTAALQNDGEAVRDIPREPTHVIISAIGARAEPGLEVQEGSKLHVGTLVTAIGGDGDWTLIARNGRELGYVPSAALVPAQ